MILGVCSPWELHMDDFFLDAGFTKDEQKAIVEAGRDERLLALVREAVEKRDQERFATLCKEGNTAHGPLFLLQALDACYPTTKKYYPDSEVRKATLSDISLWTRVYEKRHGVVGSDKCGWLAHHACGAIVRLGRLQFEDGTFPFNVTVRDAEGRTLCTQGTPVLRLHIPEGGPLLPALVDDSLLRAARWFSQYSFVTCDSWLLDPQLSLVAGTSSNIVRFMERFTKFVIPMAGEPQIFERVFAWDITKEGVLSFHCKTALQKNVQDAVRFGVSFRNTGGYLVLPR